MALRVTTSVSVVWPGALACSRCAVFFDEWTLAIKTLAQTACQCQHLLGSARRCPNQSTAHYDSICEIADATCLSGRRDSEPNTNGKRRRRAQAANRIGQRSLRCLLNTGDPESADKINESAPVPRDLRHSFAGGRRCDQPDESQGAAAKPLLSPWISAYRDISNENPTGPCRRGSRQRVRARCQNRI